MKEEPASSLKFLLNDGLAVKKLSWVTKWASFELIQCVCEGAQKCGDKLLWRERTEGRWWYDQDEMIMRWVHV